MPPRPTPSERLAIQERRQKVANAYLRGETQWDIARALGVSQATVCTDLKTIQQEWRESTLRDFDDLKARELAKINQLEQTYWQGWETSRTDGRDGNPRFLEGALRCIERRCKLLGIDAPEAHTITGPAFKVYVAESGFNPDVA